MTDQETNPKTNIVLIGALLTLLANTAATTIGKQIDQTTKYAIAITVYLFMMCAILELSTTHNIPLIKNMKTNPETLKKSYDFFVYGIILIAVIIILLTFNLDTLTLTVEIPLGIIISFVLLIVIYISILIIANKINHKKQQKEE